MSFVLNNYQQISLFDSLGFLSERKQRILNKSWAKPFSDIIFSNIDEMTFAPLYSEKRNSRPNAPVNVIVGALILKQAVELFNNNPVGTFDAILMDIMMPVMDGLAATKAIRSLNRPDAGTVPIIAMTANAFEEDVQKCLDVGTNAHLAKPLDIEKVKKTICEQIKIDCIKNNKCL